jgi:hypothetical protein
VEDAPGEIGVGLEEGGSFAGSGDQSEDPGFSGAGIFGVGADGEGEAVEEAFAEGGGGGV